MTREMPLNRSRFIEANDFSFVYADQHASLPGKVSSRRNELLQTIRRGVYEEHIIRILEVPDASAIPRKQTSGLAVHCKVPVQTIQKEAKQGRAEGTALLNPSA